MSTSTISLAEQRTILNLSKAAICRLAYGDFKGFFTTEDIEDMTQEVAIKVCKAYDNFDSSRSSMKTWIGTIASNHLKTAAGKKAARQPISSLAEDLAGEENEGFANDLFGYRGDEFEADRDINLAEFTALVNRRINLFSKTDREFIEMIQEGLTPKEMARKVGCTPNAAAKRKCIILKKLKESLKGTLLEFDIPLKKLAS